MTPEVFCICDFASSDASHKLNIIGIFDTIRSASFPFIHQFMAVAARVRFDGSEMGEKRFTLVFKKPDGEPLAAADPPPITIQLGPDDKTASGQITVIVNRIMFPAAGDYLIELAINGETVAATPLYVKDTTK